MLVVGIVAAGLLLFAPKRAQATPQASLFVAPDGTGSRCTETAPCSLTQAQANVRAINGAMSGDIDVNLFGGTYTLAAPLALEESPALHDSGTNGHNIVYQAYGSATPVLSGGYPVTGWTPVPGNDHLYQAAVPASLKTRQLFVNGVRAQRARGPLDPTGWTKTSTGFTAPDRSMAGWANQRDVELVYRNQWKEFRCPVDRIDGADVVLQNPCWNNSATKPRPGMPWADGISIVTFDGVSWVENAYALLTQPGQWYLDRASSTIYYYPRANEDVSTALVIAPALESLISGHGASQSTPLHNIQFVGLTFAYATWLAPSGGDGYAANFASIQWSGDQATNPQGRLTPGAVSCSACADIGFQSNTFEHLGAAGLRLGGGENNDQIVGNVLRDISGAAMVIGEITDFASNTSAAQTVGTRVSDNTVTLCGTEYEDEAGIFIGYNKDTTVSNNEVHNLPYTGISSGYGFYQPSYMSGNEYTNNSVHDVMRIMSDGGAIYTENNQGTSARYGQEVGNVIYNVVAGPEGVQGGREGAYADLGTGYLETANNVVSNVPHNWFNSWTDGKPYWPQGDHDLKTHNNYADSTRHVCTAVCVFSDNQEQMDIARLDSGGVATVSNAGPDPSYLPRVNNDTAPDAFYAGSSWSYVADHGRGDLGDDAHAATANGDSVTFSFVGAEVEYLGELSSELGDVDVYLDGNKVSTVSAFARSEPRVQQILYRSSPLAYGQHWLTLVKVSGDSLLVDGFVVHNVNNQSDPRVQYAGDGWALGNGLGLGDRDDDLEYTRMNGDSVTLYFSGSDATILGELDPAYGSLAVQLDGVDREAVSEHTAGPRQMQQPILDLRGLAPTRHSVTLTKLDGTFVVVDGIETQ